MKLISKSMRRGFTLVELSLAMLMGMMISGMVLAMFNQQLQFLNRFKDQSFIHSEAPIISTYVSRLLAKADRFRIYETVSDALGNVQSRVSASPVLLLEFRQLDGSLSKTILAFEGSDTSKKLNYYVVPDVGALGDPQWTITNKAKNVSFALEDGILRMTLTGPADEQIIYSGSMQQ